LGPDLDALLASENYSVEATPMPDPGALEADLGAILDRQPDHSHCSRDLLDFEQLLSGTPPVKPQDLTLDFLLEDSALSGEADLASDFTLTQSTTPDTYLESPQEDLKFRFRLGGPSRSKSLHRI
jgi:hypothetical protein